MMVVCMFQNNIKWCREELQMTQKELGFIFGVSDSAVCSWENARDSMPIKKVIRFCNLYNFSMDFVLGLTRKNEHYGKFEINRAIVGTRLKKLRTELHLTQQALSDECRISQTTYSGYETGHYLINTNNLYYICKTYNISMDWILGRTKDPKIKK